MIDNENVCLLIENWKDINRIHTIIQKWSVEGLNAKIVKDKENKDAYVPVHPEYVFRKNKKWTCWNDFLGVNNDTEEGKKNLLADQFENIAYQIVDCVYCKENIDKE